MATKKPAKKNKIKITMKEFAKGKLHSGSKTGPKVKSRKQAEAIGLNQARKEGEDVPAKPKKKSGTHRRKRNIGRS